MEKPDPHMHLDLNSPLWATLGDAYECAEKIPALLRDLRLGECDALDELYGHICHQGSIYPASIAAFPHLVAIAEDSASTSLRTDVLSLAGAISESPALDNQLAVSAWSTAFRASVPTAFALSIGALREVEDSITGVYLLKAAASFAGFSGVARVLSGFVDEEFRAPCPGCGVELYVWPAQQGLAVASEDPVSSPSAKKLVVAAGPVKDSSQYDAFDWLNMQSAIAPALSGIALRLPSLFGTASCPACATSFSLIDALVNHAA